MMACTQEQLKQQRIAEREAREKQREAERGGEGEGAQEARQGGREAARHGGDRPAGGARAPAQGAQRLTARLRPSAACQSPISFLSIPHWLTHAQGISSSVGANSCLAEGYLSDAGADCDNWCKSRELI